MQELHYHRPLRILSKACSEYLPVTTSIIQALFSANQLTGSYTTQVLSERYLIAIVKMTSKYKRRYKKEEMDV